MTKNQLETLQKIQPLVPVIRVTDLENQKGRTLLFGYDIERRTYHTYIKDGKLYSVIYRAEWGNAHDGWLYDYVDGVLGLDLLDVKSPLLVPNKRLLPECCDYEFCSKLAMRGVSLPFTTYDGSRKASKFYGMIVKV